MYNPCMIMYVKKREKVNVHCQALNIHWLLGIEHTINVWICTSNILDHIDNYQELVDKNFEYARR